jgi:hypothetical protein
MKLRSAEEVAEELGAYGQQQVEAAHIIEADRDAVRQVCAETAKRYTQSEIWTQDKLQAAILSAGKEPRRERLGRA